MFVSRIVVATCVTLPVFSLVEGKFFRPWRNSSVETIASCAKLTARRLFNPERRVDVVCNGHGDLEDAIAGAFSRSQPIFVGTGAMEIRDERIPCYVVIENGRFGGSRGTLLSGNPGLRTLQYLFVTEARTAEVVLFAGDLQRAGYRDVAFLMFDDGSGVGTIIRANVAGEEITSRSMGSCGPFANDVNRIPPFAADSRRFCPRGGCTLKYGIVTDETVSFWRKEDTLELKQNETLRAVGGLLVEHFGDYYNISIDSRAGINVPWAEAFAKLVSRDIDVAVGPKPEDLRILDNLEIVCWYMYRDIAFAGLVRVRTVDNDILKLLMPFHYLVWLCVIALLVLYVLLLIALRRLSGMGLIKERVEFAYVCAITLAQSVTLPRNHGLRLVLLLWMVFSLYLSVTYNSTFTSSLARVEAEDLLENLDEVRDSGQPLGGPAIVRIYFNNSVDRVMKDLYERYKVTEPEEALDSILTKEGIAVLQQVTVDRINWDYRNNRSLRMYTLPDPVFRIPVFFFARKGYVYRKPLRNLVTKYRESGLIYKLENVFLIEEDKQIALSQSSDEILTMKHLRPIFDIFFMCHGIGCLILLVELLHARLLPSS